MSDNDQQDVCEFTHIVLEWVEEAFKEPEAVTSSLTSKSGVPEMMDEGSNDQVFHRQVLLYTINEISVSQPFGLQDPVIGKFLPYCPGQAKCKVFIPK